MGADLCSRISPVSRVGSMRMVVTPVVFSPRRIAHSAGMAPRNFGRREKWRFKGAIFGKLSQETGRSLE